MRTLMAIALLAAAAAVLSAQGAMTTTQVAVEDNTLYEPSPGATFGGLSAGAFSFFFVGTNASSEVRRGIMRFDPAAVLPAGAQILSVELDLTVASPNGGGGDTVVSLHSVIGDWNEGMALASGNGGGGGTAQTGDVTWSHRMFPTVPWQSLGGDFGPSLSSLNMNGNGAYTIPTSPALVAAVQSMLDDPCHNFGLILNGNNGPAKRFLSRENSTVSGRPLMRMTWTPGTVTPKYIGNGADLNIEALVNGCADGNGDGVQPVFGALAETITLNFSSPNGTYNGQPFLATVQPFAIGGTPGDAGGAASTALPGGSLVPIDLTPASSAPIALINSLYFPGPLPEVLSPFADLNVIVPPSFAGVSLVFNLLVLDSLNFPSDVLAFADARELVIQ